MIASLILKLSYQKRATSPVLHWSFSGHWLHWFIFIFQNHQSQLEIFDETVAHISTWLYQAETLLDETEKMPASQQEETVKVSILFFTNMVYTVIAHFISKWTQANFLGFFPHCTLPLCLTLIPPGAKRVLISLLPSQRLTSELDDVSLRVDNVRDQAVALMNGRGVSCRELVEPKLAELNRNFEKVSQHIRSAKVREEGLCSFENVWRS